jgi:hypothetical protein
VTPEQALNNLETALNVAHFPNNSGRDVMIAFASLNVLRGLVEQPEMPLPEEGEEGGEPQHA